MKPSGKYELLRMLDDMGAIPVGSFLTRITGSFAEFFDELESLLKDQLIEIEGDEKSVKELIKMGVDLETKGGLDQEEVFERLFKEINSNPAAAEALVTLTKSGFVKAQKY